MDSLSVIFQRIQTEAMSELEALVYGRPRETPTTEVNRTVNVPYFGRRRFQKQEKDSKGPKKTHWQIVRDEVRSKQGQCPGNPDAKATNYGTYKDPSLRQFMVQAQERKTQLRHINDPLIEKKKQPRKSPRHDEPQGPLGLSEQLLQSKRSLLKETGRDLVEQ